MKFSRRMFLQGAGGAVLAIPTLTSLLPRAARAQAAAPSVRYVQWVTDHGQYADRFWPSATLTRGAGAGIKAMPLRSIDGALSQVLERRSIRCATRSTSCAAWT